MRAPLAPPRLSEPRKVEADAHAVLTSCATDRPEARIAVFSSANSASLITGQNVQELGLARSILHPALLPRGNAKWVPCRGG